jgi:hypothetical protein
MLMMKWSWLCWWWRREGGWGVEEVWWLHDYCDGDGNFVVILMTLLESCSWCIYRWWWCDNTFCTAYSCINEASYSLICWLTHQLRRVLLVARNRSLGHTCGGQLDSRARAD